MCYYRCDEIYLFNKLCLYFFINIKMERITYKLRTKFSFLKTLYTKFSRISMKVYSNYGDKIKTKASDFMKNNYPSIKGFTKRNIERMIQFYST